MKPYLVRLKADRKNAREIVGFFASPSLDHLAEMVDECCPVDQCEYRELGPGGILVVSIMPDWSTAITKRRSGRATR